MHNKELNNFTSALFVAIFYLILGLTWIYFSDSAVKAISIDTNNLTLLQTYKGFFYVFSTSIILYFLVLYFLRKQSKAMKIIEYNQELYNNIISSVENLLFVKDMDGTYIACNKAFEKFIGKSKDEIIGKKDYDLFDKEVAESFREYDKEIFLTNEPKSNFEWVTYPDGSQRYLLTLKSLLVDSKNNILGLVGNSADFTELKEKDDLMIIQSRHAAMGEMIGMIAHQWRQPLTVISMDMNNILIDIELNNLKTSDLQNCANNVMKHTQNLSKTIDDFRNFFRPDKATSRVKIQDVLEETYAIIHESLTNHNIELKTSYLSESEVDIYPRELMQVFVNIINNAKDALLIHQKNDAFIDVKVYEDEKYIVTDICDNGPGIDETVLPKIFDLYFSTKDEKVGTGLGLYMSKMIIEEHLHGKIEAFNTSESTCFRIKILKIPIKSDMPSLEK